MLPWVIKATWEFIKLFFRVVLTALGSWNVGLPKAAETMANNWVQRAAESSYPTAWSTYLFWVMYVVQLIVIVLCWLVLAHVTVFLVFFLFQLF